MYRNEVSCYSCFCGSFCTSETSQADKTACQWSSCFAAPANLNVITPVLCCRLFYFFFPLRVDGDNSATQLLHRRWHDAVTQPLVCLPPALTQSHSIDHFGTSLTSTRDDWRCLFFFFFFLINFYSSLTDATRERERHKLLSLQGPCYSSYGTTSGWYFQELWTHFSFLLTIWRMLSLKRQEMVWEHNYNLNSPTASFLFNLPICPSFHHDSPLIRKGFVMRINLLTFTMWLVCPLNLPPNLFSLSHF